MEALINCTEFNVNRPGVRVGEEVPVQNSYKYQSRTDTNSIYPVCKFYGPPTHLEEYTQFAHFIRRLKPEVFVERAINTSG